MGDVNHQSEYAKSLFRCPVCGKLVGWSDTGAIEMFSIELLREHVHKCRRAGVKPKRLQEKYENE